MNSKDIISKASQWTKEPFDSATQNEIKELLKTDDWNRLKIKAEGNRYTVWLDGQKVMTYESETALKKGPIGLQVHPDTDMEISFKKIKISVIN